VWSAVFCFWQELSDVAKVKRNFWDGKIVLCSFSFAGQNIFSTGGGLNSDIAAFYRELQENEMI